MLSAIKSNTNAKVYASGVYKMDKPFHCQKCKKEVVLKKGKVKIHHFAHKPPVVCGYGKGESEVHRKAKFEIYNSLQSSGKFHEIEIEKDLGDVVADVYARLGRLQISIEVQASALAINEIIRRTNAYTSKNIYVLWLPIYTELLSKGKYNPKAWELWLHAAYMGRVYYWMSGSIIRPIHFSQHDTYIEEREWYDEYGQSSTAGGYSKPSKRYRKPFHGKEANLIIDFKPTQLKPFAGGKIYTPERKVLVDNQNKWW